MADLCMNDTVLVQCSADRPNIFFELQEMPANVEMWLPILDDDTEIVRTLRVLCDRKVFSADRLRWRAVYVSRMKMHLRSQFTVILAVV